MFSQYIFMLDIHYVRITMKNEIEKFGEKITNCENQSLHAIHCWFEFRRISHPAQKTSSPLCQKTA